MNDIYKELASIISDWSSSIEELDQFLDKYIGEEPKVPSEFILMRREEYDSELELYQRQKEEHLQRLEIVNKLRILKDIKALGLIYDQLINEKYIELKDNVDIKDWLIQIVQKLINENKETYLLSDYPVNNDGQTGIWYESDQSLSEEELIDLLLSIAYKGYLINLS